MSDTMDGITQALLMKLTGSPDITQDFDLHTAKIITGDDRVMRIFDKLVQYKLMPKLAKVEKNSLRSTDARIMGNSFYKSNKFENALSFYSKAILFAQNDSHELALGFGNRSAVLFSMKNYEASIRDITRAFTYGYPDSLKEKLEIRLQSCQRLLQPLSVEELGLRSECKDKFRLTKSTNKAIPCAASSVTIKYTPKMGRHVIATEPLLPGDVISVEEPYAAALKEEYFLNYCYNCLTEIDDLIPCKSCCYVMFCDEKCRDESWSISHKYECPIMVNLMKLNEKLPNFFLSLKVALQAFREYGDWVKLSEAIRERERCTDNLYKGFTKNVLMNCQVPTAEYVLDSRSYLAIYTLETNLKELSLNAILYLSVQSAVLLYLLSSHTNIFSDVNKDLFGELDKVKIFLGSLLFHQFNVTRVNMVQIYKNPSSKRDYKKLAPIGFGIYAFTSMLNHSCAPNIEKCSNGTLDILVVMQPIEAGSQLFRCYVSHYVTQPYIKRQMVLESIFQFSCKCEACIGGWPVTELIHENFVLYASKFSYQNKISPLNMLLSLEGDPKAALMMFGKVCAIIATLHQKAPCDELAMHITLFKICLNVFMTKFPLKC